MSKGGRDKEMRPTQCKSGMGVRGYGGKGKEARPTRGRGDAERKTSDH